MPDWHYAEGVNSEQAHYLTYLDALRTEQPVAWALIKGFQTSESIAKDIAWPHHWVLGTLRGMKEQALVWDYEGARSIHWALTPDTPFHQMRAWFMRQLQPGGLFRRTNENDD